MSDTQQSERRDLELENKHLKEENERLKKENGRLKNQGTIGSKSESGDHIQEKSETFQTLD